MVFVKKLSLFPSFVLMQMEQEKAIGELSERKKAFFAYKNQWIKRGPKVALFHGLVEKLRLSIFWNAKWINKKCSVMF